MLCVRVRKISLFNFYASAKIRFELEERTEIIEETTQPALTAHFHLTALNKTDLGS